jgi:hypothetical protein
MNFVTILSSKLAAGYSGQYSRASEAEIKLSNIT